MADTECCDDITTFVAVNTAVFSLLITVLNADGTPYGFTGRTITILVADTELEASVHSSSTTNGEITIQDDSDVLWTLSEAVMVTLSAGPYIFDMYDDTDQRAFMFRATLPINQGISEIGPTP